MSASDFARLGFPYYDAAGNFISNDGEKQMQAAQESRRKSNGEEEMEAKERQAKEAQKGENALQEHHQHHHNNNNNSGESTVSRHLAVLTPGRRLASCIAQSKPGPSPHEAAASQHSQRGEQMRQRAKARGVPLPGGCIMSLPAITGVTAIEPTRATVPGYFMAWIPAQTGERHPVAPEERHPVVPAERHPVVPGERHPVVPGEHPVVSREVREPAPTKSGSGGAMGGRGRRGPSANASAWRTGRPGTS